MAESDSVGGTVRGRFNDETQQVLTSLYRRGMTGWGKKHSAFLDLANDKTGLTLPQIQVCVLDDSYGGVGKTRNETKRRNDRKQEATPKILILTARGCSVSRVYSFKFERPKEKPIAKPPAIRAHE